MILILNAENDLRQTQAPEVSLLSPNLGTAALTVVCGIHSGKKMLEMLLRKTCSFLLERS